MSYYLQFVQPIWICFLVGIGIFGVSYFFGWCFQKDVEDIKKNSEEEK